MSEEKATSESRVRINLSQSAKGLVQFDITAEYPTPEEAAANLRSAIDLARTICLETGLKLADTAAA